jgi:hypothetical protein
MHKFRLAARNFRTWLSVKKAEADAAGKVTTSMQKKVRAWPSLAALMLL